MKLLKEIFNIDLTENLILYNQIIINKKKEDKSIKTSFRRKVLKKENKKIFRKRNIKNIILIFLFII